MLYIDKAASITVFVYKYVLLLSELISFVVQIKFIFFCPPQYITAAHGQLCPDRSIVHRGGSSKFYQQHIKNAHHRHAPTVHGGGHRI